MLLAPPGRIHLVLHSKMVQGVVITTPWLVHVNTAWKHSGKGGKRALFTRDDDGGVVLGVMLKRPTSHMLMIYFKTNTPMPRGSGRGGVWMLGITLTQRILFITQHPQQVTTNWWVMTVPLIRRRPPSLREIFV